MVLKKVRGIAVKTLVTGAVIVGLVLVSRKFALGERIESGAFGAGRAGASLFTAPVEGFLDKLREGIGGIQSGGASVQEQLTGNRNAIGDFFGNVGNIFTSQTDDFIPSTTFELPRTNFAEESFTESSRNTVGFNPSSASIFRDILTAAKPPQNTIFDITPIKIPTSQGGLEIISTRGIVTDPNALGVRGLNILAPRAVGRRTETLQGIITTSTGTRRISGSPALFERFRQNLGAENVVVTG